MAIPASKQTISPAVLQTFPDKAHTFVNWDDQECIEIGPGEVSQRKLQPVRSGISKKPIATRGIQVHFS